MDEEPIPVIKLENPEIKEEIVKKEPATVITRRQKLISGSIFKPPEAVKSHENNLIDALTETLPQKKPKSVDKEPPQ